MASIDVGPGAEDRANAWVSARTIYDENNPSNETGKITSVELWMYSDGTGVRVGTAAFGGGTSSTPNDSTTIGNVTSGSKQVFGGLNLDVESGDLIGAYPATGQFEYDNSGGTGMLNAVGDYLDSSTSFTRFSNYEFSIYGTGSTGKDRSFMVIIG